MNANQIQVLKDNLAGLKAQKRDLQDQRDAFTAKKIEVIAKIAEINILIDIIREGIEEITTTTTIA